jgi:hypothetical protein
MNWGWATGFGPPPPGPFVKIRARYDFAILIRADGSLAYWGPEPSPLAAVPPGAFGDVAPGRSHAVGLRVDGTLTGWGDDTYGQLNVPAGAHVAIASGAFHSIALVAAEFPTPECWGLGLSGQTTPPAMHQARAIGARDNWSMAYGSLLPGAGSGSGVPVHEWGEAPGPAAPHWRFRSIDAGESFGLALMGCWADCNYTTVLTVSDFGCFSTLFGAGAPYPDCNGSGTNTVADFGCFQTRFVTDLGLPCGP